MKDGGSRVCWRSGKSGSDLVFSFVVFSFGVVVFPLPLFRTIDCQGTNLNRGNDIEEPLKGETYLLRTNAILRLVLGLDA